MRSLGVFIATSALSLCGYAAQIQSTSGTQHPSSTPYTGDLKIFEDPGRDQRLQINHVMDILHIQLGSRVADIGAGGGWFSVRAAKRVAPGGRVYAEDINISYVESIRMRAKRENITNIEPVLGKADDPKLPLDSIDAVLMLKMYHEIAWPPPLLIGVRAAMRKGALLGIIDKNGTGYDHGLDENVVREEVEHAGFKQVGRYDFVKGDGQDYFLVFEKQ